MLAEPLLARLDAMPPARLAMTAPVLADLSPQQRRAVVREVLRLASDTSRFPGFESGGSGNNSQLITG